MTPPSTPLTYALAHQIHLQEGGGSSPQGWLLRQEAMALDEMATALWDCWHSVLYPLPVPITVPFYALCPAGEN